jgi:hypothetical protein
MPMRTLAKSVVSVVVGASMLALSLDSASAFTLSAPSAERQAASPQVDKVWWGYRGGHWGWWPGAVVGGLAAGAIVGSAVAASHPYYGPYYGPGYYGPCWRWVAGPWGWHWARFC